MSEQYFSKNPQSKSDPKTWTFELRGNKLSFTSDHGVFSKSEVDFGSRLLIQSFVEPEVEGDILDLGCGYGPIGLSLAKSINDRNFLLSDVNERAVQLAEQNAKYNKIHNVEFFVSDALTAYRGRKFSAILTNPPIRAGKQVIFKMFEESYEALHANGDLWVVIQKKQGAPSARKKLEEMFETVDVVSKDKGYFIYRATKA